MEYHKCFFFKKIKKMQNVHSEKGFLNCQCPVNDFNVGVLLVYKLEWIFHVHFVLIILKNLISKTLIKPLKFKRAKVNSTWKYKGLCKYYVILFGAFSRPPSPYVIYCNILARPPPPLKTCDTVIFCHKMQTILPTLQFFSKSLLYYDIFYQTPQF